MAEQVIMGSYAAHKEFVASVLWLDYKNELLAWIESVRDELETETDPSRIRHLQGVVEACRNFLALPRQILEIMEAQGGKQ